MLTKAAIQDIFSRYIDELYTKTREEQKKDVAYYEDTFDVPEVKSPHYIYRSGIGVRIVDAPADQIVTRNPQAFFDVRKGKKDSGLRLSELVNQVWFDLLKRQNPSIFKENIKQQLGFGEAYIKVIHNENWAAGDRLGLPVHFIALNPMVIYGSPEEDINGIPDRVVIKFERQLADVITRYPKWSDPLRKNLEGKNNHVEWKECWDKDTRYFEADGEPVLRNEAGNLYNDGIQPNIYGFTPFVRKYSGFGRRSADGELSSLIVSDIRHSRDLILEECATRSNVASIEFLFAHKAKTLIAKGLDKAKLAQDISFGAYDLNYIDADPNQVRIDELDIAISPETLAHLAAVRAELNQRHPFIMAGFPMGASGRQQDMTSISAMRRYDATVENTENTFATAIEMAFRIMRKLKLKPDELRGPDLETQFKCEVKLKAVEAIERDRLETLGQREYAAETISLYTLHTSYMGMTEDEHLAEKARILADKVTFKNPEWVAVVGQAAAEEQGLLEQLEKVRQGSTGQMKTMPPTSVERIQGEVETEEGREQGIFGMRGARMSPERFVRER